MKLKLTSLFLSILGCSIYINGYAENHNTHNSGHQANYNHTSNTSHTAHNSHSVHTLNSDDISAQIANSMHAEMMKTPYSESGDIEKDYLANMIPHHQGAIDSSKILLKYTKDPRLIKIAKNIIKTQEAEVALFKQILAKKDYTTTKISKQEYQNFVNQSKNSMNEMMVAMMVKSSGNIDKDFLISMIPHHQGAIQASYQILALTKDKKVKEIAEQIIKEQQQEIKEFSDLINTL
ncbi:DUF305 domain-containing protein [Mergibacter septicus]|uniref:DUF305 domain-containing protein n=1 Tax=Mergibacter septicus TaxID=221402 RepID=UPI001C77C738|nr:DUF305 domain-containing protein [Mergibacter septicus]QDJ13637.1 DUF305 domain-containing protein [Mergibacter septicus]